MVLRGKYTTMLLYVATDTSSSSAIATSSSSATALPSSSATAPPSSSATASPSSSATAPPSSSPTAPPSSSTTASSTAAPTTTVTTAAPEAYPDKTINKESYFDLKIAFSYRDSANASTIVAELTDVFKNTPGFRKVVLNTTPNRVRRDTTLTDKFTVSFDADVIRNNTEFNSSIRQNFDTLRGVVIFGDNIYSTIDEFISKTSDICQANFVCETAYECVSGGMCRYRCKDKCTGTDVCSILVNITITTKCSPTPGPATQAPSATSNNDDERLVQVAVPLAVVLFLVILALIYACHKLHRHKHEGGGKSYSMSKL